VAGRLAGRRANPPPHPQNKLQTNPAPTGQLGGRWEQESGEGSVGGDRIDSGPPPAECSGVCKRRTPPLVVPGNGRLRAAAQTRGNAGTWIPGHPPPRDPPPRPRGSRSAATSWGPARPGGSGDCRAACSPTAGGRAADGDGNRVICYMDGEDRSLASRPTPLFHGWRHARIQPLREHPIHRGTRCGGGHR
jgi:hypothetical protein